MRELTFFTSNATKLAHARYIAESYKIKIKGFRQRTYHADYVEPRLTSRAELLEESYRSALRQCEKAGISIDSHPFILEDTSVKIDALSTPRHEVPGLDIKFWMQEQSFDALDRALKDRGNLRSATVRSDVLLHVPKNLREVWDVEEDYLIFVGQQVGSIVEAERTFESDLVYPWLDNQSFNKWFRAIGTAGPFGALSIDEANTVDFRRDSFKRLFEFLSQRSFFTSSEPEQLELELDRKPNLIICGYTCAGKTTASQHLAQKFGYLHIEASDFMYLNYYYRHGFTGDIAIGDFAERALTQNPKIAAEKVVEYIALNRESSVVISGFRALEEVRYLKQALGTRGKSFEIIFVNADQDVRFDRLKKRMRPGDNITIEQFKQRDDQQQRMGLDNIQNLSSARNVGNNSNIDNYFAQLDEIVGRAFEDAIEIENAFKKLSLIQEIKLEDAILVALLESWEDDEARPFFSTTQVAKKINQLFKQAAPKHKDNVSRYFNQDFYVYYEISSTRGGSGRRYRLSNTGYGTSIRILRKLAKNLRRDN
jgi:dephospho-CoA kinase/inosine/xanthosine triphosphate pyrophosphatase family protein